MQRAIEEKAREYGVPVIYVDPRNTSKVCPIHGAEIVYGRNRHGVCSKGGETWHRDVVACYNLLLRALGGDGGHAPSRLRALVPVDGGPVPLGPTAAHEPTGVPRALWARWRSLRPSRQRALAIYCQYGEGQGPTAAHEPTPIARGAWARWRSLGATSDHKLIRMSA